MLLSPHELESMLREGLSTPTFALGLHGVPNAVFEKDGNLYATLELLVLDPDGTIRDIKVQEVHFIPRELRDDKARIAAFVRQWKRALPVIAAAQRYEIDAIMPHDLLCFEALRDPHLRTDAEFEAVLQDLDRVRQWVDQSELDMIAEELSVWGLEARAAEFRALRRPAIWFRDSTRVEDWEDEDEDDEDSDTRAPAPVGNTRFGGEPDLPPEIEWPVHDGEPMTFAAQLDLASLSSFPAARELPSSGLLSFFYGYDWHSSFHVARVFHIASLENLARRATPARGDKRPEYTAEPFAQCDTMPSDDSPFYLAMLPEEKVAAFYRSLAEAARGVAKVLDPLPGLPNYVAGSGYDDEHQNHRLLGYPQPYQNDLCVASEMHCVHRTWDGFEPDSPEGIALSRRSRRWRLLLQVWAMIDGELLLNQDCGALYFMIPDDALAAHDWSRVWCEMQCS